jgi:hypothetical protein
MKSILSSFFIIGLTMLLTNSCTSWDGEVNGKRYYLQRKCVDGHIEHRRTFILVGKIMVPSTHTVFVCDKHSNKIDTIWEK